MFFKQFKVEGLGCLSYLVGCPAAGRAFVVDPRRDVADYVRAAEENGMRITGVIDTHVHADHISGAHELRAVTGAVLYIHESAGVAWEHTPLHAGDTFSIGAVAIEVLHTPGHTPNAVTLAITDTARGSQPQMLLTGDLLFVGSIGRPDLAGGELLDEQVENLYRSLHTTLGRFADLVEVYPAHGEGSLCGAGLSAKPSTTLGYERTSNRYFTLSFEEFKQELTGSTPHRPKNFPHIIAANREGPHLTAQLRSPARLSVPELKKAMERGACVVDLREAPCFGGAHIPGSVNIGFTPQSANWLGTVVAAERELVLLAHGARDVEAAVTHFRRAGYDLISGYALGISDWIARGEETGFLPQLSIHGLKRVREKYPDHRLLDVRNPAEWQSGHITGAVHVPLPELIDGGAEFGPGEHVSVICGSGYRSNIAGSLLKSRGHEHVYSVIGGMNAWRAVSPVEK